MQIVIYNIQKLQYKVFLIVLVFFSFYFNALAKGDNDFGKKSNAKVANKYNKIANTTNTNVVLADLSYEAIENEFAPDDAVRFLRDTARLALEAVNQSGAWVATFSENALVKVPFGIKKKIGGAEYQVVITGIEFSGSGTFARAFARVILPQRDADGNKKELYFAGTVELTRIGGIVSDGKLALIGNDVVNNSGDWALSLTGNDPKASGKIENQTYFKFDCTGFVEVGIKGEVLLSRDVYKPVSSSYEPFADPNQRCTAPVNVVVNSFSALLVNQLKFTKPFMLKNAKDYAFQIDEAILDFSDTKNPEGTEEGFAKYLEDVQPDEPNTWQGLVIKKMQVFLPREFKMKNSKDRVGFTAPYGVIDATGFSTVVNQKNILPLEKGRAGTWGFSVDELGVLIKGGALNGGTFAGKLVLPIQSKSGKDGLSYSGKITYDGEYEINVGSLNDIKASFWKAKLTLDKSSSVTLKVKDGEFLPKVNLSGKIAFNMDGDSKDEAVDDDADSPKKKKKAFSCDGIVFEELELQTIKPYFQVKAMGVEGKLHIASFEAEYSVTVGVDKKYDVTGPKVATTQTKNVNAGTTNSDGTDRASLNIALDIKLMEGKIGGKTKLAINAIYNESEGEWQFDNVVLGLIGINADFGKAKFEGELAILKNDNVYGNAFAGKLSLKVHKFEVGAKGIFGTKDDFRYWSVDAMAKGFKVQAGPITFTGFTGGVTYKMDLADKESDKLPSGILYVPSNSAFLRVRAGVLFDIVTKELITASAGFEIVFNSNWGVNSIGINGTLRMLAGDDSKGEARMKGSMRKFANAKTSAAPKEDASVWGDIFIKFDLENSVYSGEMNSYVNFSDYVVGGMGNYQSGRSSFFIGDEKWYINVGTDKTPNSIKLQGPISITGTGYFMMGNNISSPYGSGNFGLKHGLSASIELSANYGWIRASFGGALKYDILLMHTNGFQCNGAPAGLNGWFGEGRVVASLYGSVDAHFHKSMPWFLPDININANIFRASLSASLFLSGPKPFYASGNLKGRYHVFIFSGSFSVDFSRGTRCGTPPPPPYKLNAKDQAVEDAIRARRLVLVNDYNKITAEQNFKVSKDYLNKGFKSYLDSLLWLTPIDTTKNGALLVQGRKYLNNYLASKASESNILAQRDSVLGKFNNLLSTIKGAVRKDTLKTHVGTLVDEKYWATPIDQPKANDILKKELAYVEKYLANKAIELKENQSRAQTLETNNNKLKELGLLIVELTKKAATEKNAKEKVNLLAQINVTTKTAKNTELDIKKDQLLTELYSQLDNTNDDKAADIILDRIAKLKAANYTNLEALTSSLEKTIAAEKEAKRKEEEKKAAEKKALEELQNRQTKAIAAAPSDINKLKTFFKPLGNALLEKLKKANTATDIKVALDALNKILNTKY